MSNPNAFDAAVGDGVFRFQLLEEVLKDYLSEVHKQAHIALGHRIPFKSTRERFANWPLGKLVNEFKYYTDDTELVKKLRRLTDDRNILTHRAYIHIQNQLGPHPGEIVPRWINWEAEVKNLDNLGTEAFMAYHEVYRELQIARNELLPTARPNMVHKRRGLTDSPSLPN